MSAAACGMDVVRTVLQPLVLTAAPGLAALRWRMGGQRHRAEADACGGAEVRAPSLHPGETLCLDTFLNGFYERYWRELTSARRFALEIETSGPCTVQLVRLAETGTRTVIGEKAVAGDAVRTSLAVPPDAAVGVLYAEVTARDGPATVHGGRWTAGEGPPATVRLAVAICSFAQDDMLAETLLRIAPEIRSSGSVVEVVVVHQGASDLDRHPGIAELRSDGMLGGRLRIVRQENFGGSGGFARGMLEAEASGATHVLLMDDDVRVEPGTIDRLTVLLGYLMVPATIGGQMLDRDRPTRLFASHEAVDLRDFRLRNPFADTDLAAPGAIARFARRHRSAYNAWWFCCIPVSLIKRCGLPLPLFIRHDDVEHGLRTTRSGAEVVTMPGLFVWHAAFQDRAKPWQVYYERRNFLIMAALHGRTNVLHATRLFVREAWIGLAMGRYDYCWTVCRAAEDFLEGPASAFADPRGRHGRIVRETAQHMLRALDGFRRRGGASSAAARNLRGWVGLVRLLRLAARRGSEAARVRRLAIGVVTMGFRLGFHGSRAARAYRAEAPRYVGDAFWRGYLGLARREPRR